jgi:hypothetical protein
MDIMLSVLATMQNELGLVRNENAITACMMLTAIRRLISSIKVIKET